MNQNVDVELFYINNRRLVYLDKWFEWFIRTVSDVSIKQKTVYKVFSSIPNGFQEGTKVSRVLLQLISYSKVKAMYPIS